MIKEKKVALVTGGTKGLGASMSKALLKKNFFVIATYARDELNAKTFMESLDDGHDLSVFKCDINDRSEVIALTNYLIAEHGCVDVLVNNAGVNLRETIWDITEESWDLIFNTNLKSQFFFTRDCWPLVKLSHLRRIVFISSVAGQYHGPRTLHYATSKAGLISMTKVFARYGVKDNIFVNCIAPGLIITDQTREEFESGAAEKIIKATTLLQRPGEVEDVCSALEFLIDPNQKYFTGQVLSISGGAIL